MKNTAQRYFDYMRYNYMEMERNGKTVFKLPLALIVVFLIFGWKLLVPLMLVSLFFEYTYSFTGMNDMNTLNQAMEKVTGIVQNIRKSI